VIATIPFSLVRSLPFPTPRSVPHLHELGPLARPRLIPFPRVLLPHPLASLERQERTVGHVRSARCQTLCRKLINRTARYQ
jgi:hypothetical protein